MTHTTLTEFHQILADAIRRSRPLGLDRPVTVAEIYQDLVPYRAVRGVLSLEMNAEYELALLRLLAGEGGHVRLEPAEAREELAAEIASPNPNVGLYRKFAACDVWVAPASPGSDAPARRRSDQGAEDAGAAPRLRLQPREAIPFPIPAARAEPPPADDDWLEAATRGLAEPRPETSAEPDTATPGRGDAATTAAEPAEPKATRAAPAVPDIAPAGSAATPSAPVEPADDTAASPRRPVAASDDAAASAVCAFCDGPLPGGRPVRFCPHCGGNQAEQPCRVCGEVLERDWRYCIACGTEAEAGD